MAKVKALRDFSNPNIGSHSEGDSFEYDAQKDSEGLVKLGIIEKPETKVENKGGKDA